MTKLEAYKEAARRDGATEAQITIFIRRVILNNALPPDSYEQIPAGEEEAFIQKQIPIKRAMAVEAAKPGIPEMIRQLKADADSKIKFN